MNTPATLHRSASAIAATGLLFLGVTTGSAEARQDPGTAPATVETTTHRCGLARVGTQFVRCDDRTGHAVAAPAWGPPVASSEPWHRGTALVDSDGSLPAPARTVQRVTTSGSAAGGFAWSTDEHFDTTVDCATFDAHLAVSVTDRFTVTLDSNGTITSITESLSAPRSVWTNTDTGASAVVAGHYEQVANRIPGTHDFQHTVTGSRTLGDAAGNVASSKAVRRVIDKDPDTSPWRDLAGHHDFADAMLTQPTLCSAIT
jgi:hypothetical protein